MSRTVSMVVTAPATLPRSIALLKALARAGSVRLQLIASASAVGPGPDNVVTRLASEQIQPTYVCDTLLVGDTLAGMVKTTALGMTSLADIWSHDSPDVVVTSGDRYETLGTAVAASYLNIPLVHLQGGELCGSIDGRLRHAISKLADYHFVSNDAARQFLLRIGEPSDRVVVTGCPSIDLLLDPKFLHETTAMPPDEVIDLYYAAGARQVSQPFVVVLHHGVTTDADDGGTQARELLAGLRRACDRHHVIWVLPNVDHGSAGIVQVATVHGAEQLGDRVTVLHNIDPRRFFGLLLRADCLIGNSSVSIREGAFLGLPAVNIGSRQANRVRGPNVVDVEPSAERIARAIRQQLMRGRYPSRPLYGDGQTVTRIVSLLSSMKLERKS